MPTHRFRTLVALAAVIVSVLAVPGALAATTTVSASNYLFSPNTAAIHLGDTVTWAFAGEPHSVTSGTTSGGVGQPDGRFDSGVLVAGSTYTLGPGGSGNPFTTPGSYPYFCQIHPEQMTGTIVVLGTSTPTPNPTPRPTLRPTPRPTPAPAPTPIVTPAPSPSSSEAPRVEPSVAASPDASASGSASATATALPSPSAAPVADRDGGLTAPALLAVTIAVMALAIGGAALYLRRSGPA